ncbi:YqaJ viral recombinase family protein [Variovorax sp. WS11]|uniref:YqaJ viral recombinase family protein n=1 Tax=Variovorax sp. WS11 TaxID=1105204 RepID=UPI0013DBD5F5|nr:YqaJ viral recombinase family protein [Variovorax sp. WS11]NDZ11527.1 endonuclease [Variovorax sp. WS11]
MERIVHDLVQGVPAWDEFRLTHFGASEIAAVLGLSKTTTRTELLRAKKTGIAKEFGDWLQRNVLDRGHEIEALARPLAVEFAGVDGFYPATASIGRISASSDGLDMLDETAWECKSLNAQNGPIVRAGQVPEEHMPQCQQVLMVTGADRLLFTVSDGTRENTFHVWVEPDTTWFDRIRAAWAQFEIDLAAYVPVEIKERPAAEVTLALPALVIHAKGEITTSNMKEYGDALTRRLAEVRAIQLVTDQDFSNAKESAKLLRENIQQAKHAKEAMLAQTVTVGEAARMIDSWCEDMRQTALKLEQDVEREDRVKKAAMLAKARTDYEAHIEALKVDTGGPWIVLPSPDWPGAIKSKRSFASMQDALDTMLANAKIVADESARKIRASLACMAEEGKGYEFLLADRLAHIGKPVEDVRILVRARITEHKATEERRAAELAERERARIRAEEEDRARAQAAREQQDREAAERREREEAEGRKRQQEQEAAAREQQERQQTLARTEPQREAPVAPAAAPAPTVIPMPARPAATPAGKPTLSLGQLKERLAPIQITADGLATLGFTGLKDRGSVLFHEAEYPHILAALVAHVQAIQAKQAA